MTFRDRILRELGDVDSDLRQTPPLIWIVISCLALILAATIAFGGLHI